MDFVERYYVPLSWSAMLLVCIGFWWLMVRWVVG